jgi:Uma2 family endonuclease
MTADDLWALGKDDVRRELVDGRVVEMGPAGSAHGNVSAKVCGRLEEHVRRFGGGEVFTADTGFVLALPDDPERVRAPDVALVSSHRVPEEGLPSGFFLGAPDLVVEVLSPSDDAADVQQRVRDFLEAGARLVWLFAPQARTVTAFRADGSARLLREHETLDGEELLPGLQIPLAEIFA